LRTKGGREAAVRIGPIRDTLYRLEQGTLQVPPEADNKAFILSGGRLTSKPRHEPGLSVGGLAELYLANRKVEPNTLKTLTFHFNHLKRILKLDKSLESIGPAAVQGYANVRAREQHHGKIIQTYTKRKELRTFRQPWTWALEMAHTNLQAQDPGDP
jgi:hypothetical protein